MQSNKNDEILKWKELSGWTSVTHFSSFLPNQQIYLKRIKPHKKIENPITVFLFHDLASYHGRFYHLINWFKSRHPEVGFVMMDFLGHGLSSGTRGHIEHFNHLVNDVAHVFRVIEKAPGERWIALGHGIGALSLLDLVNRFDESIKNKIDKLVLSNFILNFNSPVLNIQNRLLEKIMPLEGLMRTTRPLEIYMPEEILTYPREQGVYMEDPLIVRKPTFQTFRCINLKMKSVFQDSYFLDRPTLILQSESPYLLTRGMDSFSKGLKKGLLSEKKYSNLKHDLYNEKDNLSVFNDIAEWIQS
jgi:alpha-beta hydrolase superfamily lysophospholipase